MSFCIFFYILFFFSPVTFQICAHVVMCLQHIDQIMSSHGKQIMQAVTLILEADHSIEVKEQVKTNKCSLTLWCWLLPCFQSYLLVHTISERTESFAFVRRCVSWPTLLMVTQPRTSSCPMMTCFRKSNITWYTTVAAVFSQDVFGCCLSGSLDLCRDILMWNCSSLPPSASQTSSGTKRTVRDWPYNEWVNIYSRCQDFFLNQE